MRTIIAFTILCVCTFHNINAQSRLNLGIGISACRSVDYWEELGGGGVSLLAEINNAKINFFSLEFRAKVNIYSYSQEDILLANKEFDFQLHAPSISVVPKFSVKITDDMKIQFENEFSINYCQGKINNGEPHGRKKIPVHTLFSYSPAISLRGDIGKAEAAIGFAYSTLDFSNMINKYTPNKSGRGFHNLQPHFTISLAFYFININL